MQRTDNHPLGRLGYPSVGKWAMKHDGLLMSFPKPGFREDERHAEIVGEQRLSSPSTRRRGKAIPVSSNVHPLSPQASGRKAKNASDCRKRRGSQDPLLGDPSPLPCSRPPTREGRGSLWGKFRFRKPPLVRRTGERSTSRGAFNTRSPSGRI